MIRFAIRDWEKEDRASLESVFVLSLDDNIEAGQFKILARNLELATQLFPIVNSIVIDERGYREELTKARKKMQFSDCQFREKNCL